MASPEDYNAFIDNAFEEHEGDVVGFIDNLMRLINVGLPENLLIAAKNRLQEETDPIKAIWLRFLIARINARKHQNHLIPAELEGIPEDESLPKSLRMYAYNLIAGMHIANAEYDRAIECCRKGLALSESSNDPATIEILNSLGECNFNLGRYEEALDFLRMYMKAHEETGREISSRAYNNLAVIQGELGNAADAKEAYKTALEIERKARNPISISVALSNISGFLLTQNEPGQALDYAEKAFKMMKGVEDHMALMLALINLSEAHMMLGNLEAAIEPAEQGLFFATNSNRKVLIAEAKLHNAVLFAKLGRPDAAERLKEAIEYNDSLSLERQPDSLERAHYEYARLVDPKTGYELLLKAREVARTRSHMPSFKIILKKIDTAIRNSPANPKLPSGKRSIKRKSSRRRPKP
ncbi:MAG: tetratricopeptide repeat protein [Planctomycetota bacterium]|nr:MAG: tetratricopeptide repeat protein [Planctomycetota bacterium]